MFFGVQHGLHYLDHFAFLHEAMFGIQGAMSSYYQYYTNEEFSLAIDLKMFEKMKSVDDGFMLLLSSNPFKTEYLTPSTDNSVSGFENRLGMVGSLDRNPRVLLLPARQRAREGVRGPFGRPPQVRPR